MSTYVRGKIQNLDFSAVRQHFKIMDLLRSGQEVTDNQWDELFNTPAYKTLLNNEFHNRVFFQVIFLAAYAPGYSTSVEEILSKIDRKGTWWKWWVESMLEAYKDASLFKNQLTELIGQYQKLELNDFAIKEAKRFLPDKRFEGFPKIAFIIFNDSRGYDPIILSLNSFLRTNDPKEIAALDCMVRSGYSEHFGFKLLYAHEAFHYYRNKKEEFRFPDDKDPYFSLIWTMDQIENEGIADQIDKANLYFRPGCYKSTNEGAQYLNYLKQQPDLIFKMDSILAELAAHPDSAQKLSSEFRELIPRSGHQTGYYMCNAIIHELGEKSLKNIARNPFKFFKLYQQAALKNKNLNSFSEKSMNCIEMLGKRYQL